ncbi:hypothetical protein ACFYOC_19130 [Nocardiopsis alba]|uniref:hypothetical protein n=1 Tax=Nocardiopsis alba TaxID=53437 RepID=UPI00369D2340
MDTEAVWNLLALIIFAMLFVGFFYWPKSGKEPPRFLLRIGVWGGYTAAFALLMTDVAWPEVLTGVSSSSEGFGCPPVVGRSLWLQTTYALDESTCAPLADARLGLALLCAIGATLCLVALTRLRLLAAITASTERPAS